MLDKPPPAETRDESPRDVGSFFGLSAAESHCPACGYDLRAIASIHVTCPECGLAHALDPSLRRPWEPPTTLMWRMTRGTIIGCGATTLAMLVAFVAEPIAAIFVIAALVCLIVSVLILPILVATEYVRGRTLRATRFRTIVILASMGIVANLGVAIVWCIALALLAAIAGPVLR